jgi:glycosyltransferase involved in cell wall biosynthesis
MTEPADDAVEAGNRPVGERWVTVLSPTMTGNGLFRTQTITRLLRGRFRVQLIGFDESSATYAPLATDSSVVAERRYYSSNIAGWFNEVRRLAPAIKGSVIVCVKPLLGSAGAGLLLGRRLRLPVIMDIDDWERGFLYSSHYWEMRHRGLGWAWSTHSPLYTRLLDGLTYRASAVTVSNSFLQAVFGGHWIPHLRDDFRAASSAHPEPGRKVVLFAGKPRIHKGLGTLIDAWRHVNRSDAILRLIVPDVSDPELLAAGVSGLANVELIGPIAFDRVPDALAAASIVVIPQDNSRGSVGQLPAKLLDSMSAGKPVITTDVGDASRWLAGGAGVVVTPGSAVALARAIDDTLDHPERWERMGRLAYERWRAHASFPVLEDRLCRIVDSVSQGKPLTPVPAFAESEGA